jgi:hypothetical protein
LIWPCPAAASRRGTLSPPTTFREPSSAVEWDTLPALIPGRPDYRLLIGNGTVVAVYAIEAQLARDGTVELVNITVHTTGLPAVDENPG